MSHTIVITTVRQAVAELTDEEYAEYLEATNWERAEILDPWISDSEVVYRTFEEV